MTAINTKIEAMKKEVTEQVNKMTVVEMRKQASVYGLKNVKKYRRPELSEKLIAQIFAAKESTIKAEAEAEEKAAAEKKAKKAATKKTDKRYKASKVTNDEVQKLVDEIVNSTPEQVAAMDLYSVNRKVLIGVMKALHCKLWYRTYDKPTMIAKINDIKNAEH